MTRTRIGATGLGSTMTDIGRAAMMIRGGRSSCKVATAVTGDGAATIGTIAAPVFHCDAGAITAGGGAVPAMTMPWVAGASRRMAVANIATSIAQLRLRVRYAGIAGGESQHTGNERSVFGI